MEEMIEVYISPKGEVKIEASGFKGTACEEATRALEDALGRVVTDDRKSEYYEPEKVKATL